jgi:hypothetical protein
MKEIIVSEQVTDNWIVAKRRAEGVSPERFAQTLDEIADGVKRDRERMAARQAAASDANLANKIYRQA